MDKDEPKNSVKLMDISYYAGKGSQGFGEQIDQILGDCEEDDSPRRRFHRLKGGMTLEVSVKEGNFKGRQTYNPVRIEMISRAKDYDEDMLEEMPCLDDLLVEMEYDELESILKQKSKKDDDEDQNEDEGNQNHELEDQDETPEDEDKKEEDTGETAEDKGIEDGTKVKHKKFGVCEVVHVSGDGTSLRLKDEDGEVHKGVAPSECKVIEEESEDTNEQEEESEEDEKLVSRGKKPVQEDEDNDSEWGNTDDDSSDSGEDQDEEKPEPEKKSRGRPRK